MRIEAHAKINWTLEVLGMRPDGYHDLKSVVLPVPLHDDVFLDPAPTLDASALPYGEKDLMYRAAEALRRRVPAAAGRGAALRVEKRIPAGGGLGGGSADAAATLCGLNRLWNLELSEDTLISIAAEVGSDVPALVLEGCVPENAAASLGAVMMEGRGERVRRMTAAECAAFRVPDPRDVVLRFPGIASSTPAVYRAFAPEDRGRGRNDLQPAAVRLYPDIGAALAAAEAEGLRDVAMSGSGSTVYGVRAERERWC